VATTVLVRMQAKPGEGDQLVEVVNQISPDTVSRDGALSFELVRDLDDPDTLVMIEKWRDRADHEAYAAWREETQIGVAELFAVVAAVEVKYLETVREW
jgi:quinol monooxygenase YgiN